MKTLISIAAIILLAASLSAQGKYWVYFKDKGESTYDPHSDLHPKAIERRIREGFDLYDKHDFPVSDSYLNELAEQVDTVRFASRWLNAACCWIADEDLDLIQNLAFVLKIEALPQRQMQLANEDQFFLLGDWEQQLECQTAIHEVEYFHQSGFTGKGVRVAIFDAGFTKANEQQSLKQIIDDKRLIATRDFVTGRDFKWKYSGHGTATWSTVGGMLEDKLIGMAVGAEFLLARTERHYMEVFSEEENWIAALEWADQMGVDIVNSSLGYTNKRYFTSEMNGKVAPVSIAANMAAQRGILVVSSAGNEGASDWEIMGAPADADSVLSVGGISPYTGIHTPFSSYGPTADKRMKPNVTAYGHVVAASPHGLNSTQGTSFSSPLVAGFAACLRQANPDITVMELFHKIEESGHLYPYYDYAHGYGIPLASKALEGSEPQMGEIVIEDGKLRFFLPNSPGELVPLKEEQQLAVYCTPRPSFYWHVENLDGYLSKYKVVDPLKGQDIFIDLPFQKGSTIRARYLNQYYEYVITE